MTVNGADKLEVLDCSRNKLTALDVSELKRLRRLDCSLNPDMSSIVVNGADGLDTLVCNEVGIGSLVSAPSKS